MKNNSGKKLVSVLIFSLFSLSLLLLADSPQTKTDEPAPNLKQEVVKLKYISSNSLLPLLVPYEGRYTKISFDPHGGNILIVSDTPENLEKILAAIRKIDVKPRDLVFTIQVITASESKDQTDPELKSDPLIKELQKLLRFRSYQLLDATMVRGLDRKESMTIFGPNNQFDIFIKPEVAEDSPQANIRLEVRLRQVRTPIERPGGGPPVWTKIDPLSLINSHLNLKSGDRAVVGVSRLAQQTSSGDENKGLILIISGKALD